jgi:PTS system nitrogen regulatory IIA component
MHFGATLRLLRLDSGLSLRDLARRLDVSGAYLSRVENGIDAAPTPTRLKVIARELGVSEPLLLGLAHQVSPLVLDYVREEPAAAALFLDIAQRRLNAPELDEIREFVRARFPADSAHTQLTPLSEVVDPDSIVIGLSCSDLQDVFDVAGGRLSAVLGSPGPVISASLEAREREAPCAIGGGVAIPCAEVDGPRCAVALITLAPALRTKTPDRIPLGTIVVLAGPRSSSERRQRLLQLARWTARGLSSSLAEARTPTEVLSLLTAFEGDR